MTSEKAVQPPLPAYYCCVAIGAGFGTITGFKVAEHPCVASLAVSVLSLHLPLGSLCLIRLMFALSDDKPFQASFEMEAYFDALVGAAEEGRPKAFVSFALEQY